MHQIHVEAKELESFRCTFLDRTDNSQIEFLVCYEIWVTVPRFSDLHNLSTRLTLCPGWFRDMELELNLRSLEHSDILNVLVGGLKIEKLNLIKSFLSTVGELEIDNLIQHKYLHSSEWFQRKGLLLWEKLHSYQLIYINFV